MMSQETILRMTAKEFSQLPESNTFIELINGVVVVSPSPVSEHQRIVRRLSRFIEDVMPNGEVMPSPMDLYLDDVNVFQPDIFWIAENSPCIEKDGYFYGAPELVVKVLSPSTSTRDKREKFASYEQHKVLEYWIVDGSAEHIEVWQRKEEKLQRLGIFIAGDSFVSIALTKKITLPKIFS